MKYSRELSQSYQQAVSGSVCILSHRDLPELLARYVTTGRNALDFGCGSGSFISLLKSNDFQVEGMDVSPDMLAQALKANKNIPFTHIDPATIPREDQTYDLVLICFVLVEIGDFDHFTATLREIHRVLKPGGICLILGGSKARYLPGRQWLHIQSGFPSQPPLESGSSVKVHLKGTDITFDDYYWSEDDHRKACESVGLDLLAVHSPLGKPGDDIPWQDECHTSPLAFYITRRP